MDPAQAAPRAGSPFPWLSCSSTTTPTIKRRKKQRRCSRNGHNPAAAVRLRTVPMAHRTSPPRASRRWSRPRPSISRHRPGTGSTRTTAAATPDSRARRYGRRHLGLAPGAHPDPGPSQPIVVATRTIGQLSSQSTGIRPTRAGWVLQQQRVSAGYSARARCVCKRLLRVSRSPDRPAREDWLSVRAGTTSTTFEPTTNSWGNDRYMRSDWVRCRVVVTKGWTTSV